MLDTILKKKNMNLKRNFLSNPYIQALGICYGNDEKTDGWLDVSSSCGITEEKFSMIIGEFLERMNSINIYPVREGFDEENS